MQTRPLNSTKLLKVSSVWGRSFLLPHSLSTLKFRIMCLTHNKKDEISHVCLWHSEYRPCHIHTNKVKRTFHVFFCLEFLLPSPLTYTGFQAYNPHFLSLFPNFFVFSYIKNPLVFSEKKKSAPFDYCAYFSSVINFSWKCQTLYKTLTTFTV